MTLLDIVAGVIVGVSFPFVVLRLTAFVTGIRRGRAENRERRKRDRDRRIAALERELGIADPARVPANWRRLAPGEEPGPTELLVTRIDGDRFAIGHRPDVRRG